MIQEKNWIFGDYLSQKVNFPKIDFVRVVRYWRNYDKERSRKAEKNFKKITGRTEKNTVSKGISADTNEMEGINLMNIQNSSVHGLVNSTVLSKQLRFTGTSAECPPSLQLFYAIFGDCPDSWVKILGFVIGILSLIIWTAVAIPQLVENYQLKESKGLSLYFLSIWELADVFNIAGAFLSRQLAVQKALGMVFLIEDTALIAQYLYYRFFYPKRVHPGSATKITVTKT
ncbi:hypothetical protein AB6A40_006340, partial [Gnathostoma spinigerum]